MKRSWAGFALKLIGAGEPAAMVTLAAVEGSAPRDAGTRMIVGREAIFGTVGGGNLEHLLIDQARKLMEASSPDVLQQDYPLGPLLAQCCGGRVRVLIERLTTESRGWLSSAHALERAGERYTLRCSISDRRVLRTVEAGWPSGAEQGSALFDANGAAPGRKDEWTRIVEHVAPVATPLYVFGAGHVGGAIVHIAATLPFRLTWLDSRPEMSATQGAAPLQIRDDLAEIVRSTPPGAFFLVLTHAHELDYKLVHAILSRGDAAYCGLIGSDTKRARFVSRLAKEGIDPSSLICPIGAGSIRSKDPAAIAVGVAAELLMKLEAAEAVQATERRSAP